MNGIVYLTLLWYLWLIETFIATKDRFRFLTAFVILWLIITYPLEWNVGFFVIKPSFLLLYLSGFLLLAIMKGRQRWRLCILSGAFAFLFASLRMAEWYEPIIFLFGHTLTYVCGFFFLILLVTKSFLERLTIGIVASIAGEIIYQVQLFPLTSTIFLGQSFFLDYLVIVLSLFYGWNVCATLFYHVQRVTLPHNNMNLPH